MAETSKAELDEREREVGQAALEVLTKQFKHKFDFLRELVQNSLDAGTPEVEVWMNYRETEGGQGVCEIHVDDYGEGMNEHIIDNELTRLFSSTKEDDFTKIGRFGIGFVSVFAIQPDGVMIHTSRGGENWEVFFHNDGTFEKIRMDNPVDGSKVTVFKSMSRREYEESVKSVLETLKFWCKHAEKKITFWDATLQKENQETIDHPFSVGESGVEKVAINEPLKIGGFCSLEIDKGGTEIAMAFSMTPFYGFYNKGLTLCESNASEVVLGYEKFFNLVAFKVKSHYLEHTLTRDTILRDNNYTKAIHILVETARNDLILKLLSGLEKRAKQKTLAGDDLKWYLDGAEWLFSLTRELDPTFRLPEKFLDVKDNVSRALMLKFKTRLKQKSIDADEMKLFRRCNGRGYTMKGVGRCIENNGGMLFISGAENKLTAKMKEEGLYVFLSPPLSIAADFFKSHIPSLEEWEEDEGAPAIRWVDYCFWLAERKSRRSIPKPEGAFLSSLEKLLKKIKFPVLEVGPAEFSFRSEEMERMCCFVKHKSSLGSNLKIIKKLRNRDLVLNRLDPTYQKLVETYSRAPLLALLFAVERIMLETGIGLDYYQDAVNEIYG